MDAIDSRKIDPGFKFQIAKEDGGQGILKCFACGACTARCPEMDVKPEWNARVIIRKALLGLKEEVLSSEFYWICSAHYRCLEKCPQKVDVKEVINAVRDARLLEEQTEDITGMAQKKYLDLEFKYHDVVTIEPASRRWRSGRSWSCPGSVDGDGLSDQAAARYFFS